MTSRGRLHRTTWGVSAIVGGTAILLLLGSGLILRMIYQLLVPNTASPLNQHLSMAIEFTLFTCSTGFVVEMFLRRAEEGRGIRPADMLDIGLAAIIMVAILMNEHRLWLDALRKYNETLHLSWDPKPVFPWMGEDLFPCSVLLLFGLGCVSYVIARSGVLGLSVVCSQLRNLCGAADKARPRIP